VCVDVNHCNSPHTPAQPSVHQPHNDVVDQAEAIHVAAVGASASAGVVAGGAHEAERIRTTGATATATTATATATATTTTATITTTISPIGAVGVGVGAARRVRGGGSVANTAAVAQNHAVHRCGHHGRRPQRRIPAATADECVAVVIVLADVTYW
jgi:hypothetical protein